MSQYAIFKLADKYGINHNTAGLIWEFCDTPAEYEQALEDYANGEGFVLID